MARRLTSLSATLRRRLAEQRGMTVVETVVAALVLVIAALGVFQVVDASTRNTFRAEQSQVVVNRIQAELEDVRQLSYDEVALTSVPAHDPAPASPNWRVSEGQFALARDGSDPAPLVYQGSPLEGGGQVGDTVAAAVEPGPEPFQSGDVSGQIHRYVVWIDDEACGESCPGSQNLKRVVVVAALDATASGGTRAYQELQTDIVDPDTTPIDNPAPGGDEDQTRPATFWLTDTGCEFDERGPITADHPTHNTHWICEEGVQLGGTPGAPDLMHTEQADEDAPELPEQPLYDYSTDVGNGPGLRMRPPSVNGCLLPGELPPEEVAKEAKLHVWLSRPMPAGYQLDLTGEATLDLWTRRVDQATPHEGRVCVWLFKRRLDDGEPVDSFAANLDPPVAGALYYHGNAGSPSAEWPRQWTEITVPMSFAAPFEVTEGERLGLALSIDRGGSAGKRIDFMYDHPNFRSRFEVKTTSELDSLLGTE